MKKVLLAWLILTLADPVWLIANGKVDFKADYRTANRDSAGIAPEAANHSGAVVQFYSARAFNWRGAIASHCWVALKPANASTYTVYQVVGWLKYRGLPALSISQDLPDRNWYNAEPTLILDIRGKQAEQVIPKIQQASRDYPYSARYVLWPGPNSNTYPAYLGRMIPELGLVMSADAVGKDFLGGSKFFASAPSNSGYQLSLYGILGITIARKEGLEINLLGLTYGLRFSPLRILLPGISS